MPSGFAIALTSAMLVTACRSDSAATRAGETVTRPGRAGVARLGAAKPAEPAEAVEPTGPGACVGRGGEAAKPGMRNVIGTELRACPSRSTTGFYRDGFCSTDADDAGVHVVCATVTDAFLRFSANHGNDLITPRGEFPGLRDGDAWCLCAARFREALDAGVAPPVVVEATDEAALRTMTSSELSASPVEICRAPR
jgi:uncharacterized protein (DUF2237 family)